MSVLVYFTFTRSEAPGQNILGVWVESEWNYEKFPDKDTPNLDLRTKERITKDLIIHKAEIWEIHPNGTLTLHGETSKKLNWTLKGRGHILKIEYPDKRREHYTLHRLNPNEMELHFHSDIEARGIVKLVFKKKEKISYAQKI
ncbi:hypothetical protein DMZ48_05885 [Robertkochia solimangrovi]|nr:hypothetical protein DMZ48_05885 [Robertkochia solimangrovi]